MSAVTNVLINGIDVSGTGYGFEVTSYNLEQGERGQLTLSGHIKAASNDAMQVAYEALLALCGRYDAQLREVFVTLNYLDSAGALSGDAMSFRARLKRTDYNSTAPAFLQHAAAIQLEFDLLTSINPDGTVTQTITPVGTNIYFEDANAAHGASRVISRLHNAAGPGATAQFNVQALAVRSRFVDMFSSAISSGSHPSVGGLYGKPAVNFPTADNNTIKYVCAGNLPVYGLKQASIMIRFKRNYTIGDGAIHVLLADDNGVAGSGLLFALENGASSQYMFAMGGTAAATTSGGNTISATEWNTIIGTSDDTTLRVTLKTPSGTYTATTTSQTHPSPGTFFWLGTDQSGNYRSDCVIGEVVIYKYPLGSAARTALLDASHPVIDIAEHDLNRRIAFYLDFTNGFTGIRNDSTKLSALTAPFYEASVYAESDRQTIYKVQDAAFGHTDMVGDLDVYTALSWPVVERYNNFLMSYNPASSPTFYVSYLPHRRP